MDAFKQLVKRGSDGRKLMLTGKLVLRLDWEAVGPAAVEDEGPAEVAIVEGGNKAGSVFLACRMGVLVPICAELPFVACAIRGHDGHLPPSGIVLPIVLASHGELRQKPQMVHGVPPSARQLDGCRLCRPLPGSN